MLLTKITTISASLELITGLHIGAGDGMMQIGGVDNQVIRHPVTKEPYIPGSSLKGKVRSLLEWRSGAVREAPLGWRQRDEPGVRPILQLFGLSGSDDLNAEEAKEVGPTRLSFWDCPLSDASRERMRQDNLSLTEIKSENSINRITGTAEHPRQMERVPAGTSFDFCLSLKRLDSDAPALLDMVLAGLKLLEMDSLGGSGSRGYGKVKFIGLKIDDEDAAARFDAINPFTRQG
jgi:CRISPR-associated protein Csm3